MKYLKLYENYSTEEKKLIISEIEDLIIDILELPELFDYNIRFPNNLILIGEVRMSLFFNRSKDINKILLSNIYKLNNLFNKYFFHFDITLYNPSTGGLFNPITNISIIKLLEIIKGDNTIYEIEIYMVPIK